MYSHKDVLWHCKYLWNYKTDQHKISGQYLKNENVPGVVVLWRHNKAKMADGRHFEDRKITISQWKIVRSIKFGTLQQILNPWQSCDQKLKFLKFKMAAAAILKIAVLVITHRPIVQFQRNFVRVSRTACRRGLHDKNCKFLKSKMAAGRRFENR